MSPQATDLNKSPYWDDFGNALSKNYYRQLFKPSVSVQTRELNQLQSMLQDQIEKFGDNIFTSGTVISGCNYQPLVVPYICIRDLDIFGNSVIPINYLGYNVKNETTGVTAIVMNYANGFETTAPNLKTLYLAYRTLNSDDEIFAFAPGDTVTVYNPVLNPIQKINVINGGLGFSNTDKIIAVSAIVVVNSAAFTNGQAEFRRS